MWPPKPSGETRMFCRFQRCAADPSRVWFPLSNRYLLSTRCVENGLGRYAPSYKESKRLPTTPVPGGTLRGPPDGGTQSVSFRNRLRLRHDWDCGMIAPQAMMPRIAGKIQRGNRRKFEAKGGEKKKKKRYAPTWTYASLATFSAACDARQVAGYTVHPPSPLLGTSSRAQAMAGRSDDGASGGHSAAVSSSSGG